MYALTVCQKLPSFRTFILYNTCEEPVDLLIPTVLTVLMCVSWMAEGGNVSEDLPIRFIGAYAR